jgi:tRNA pseudouridine55 synthase
MTSGIVLLDKPPGLSSNAVLQRVKRAFAAVKAGHAGTLDPLATGMLPILLGEATKIAGYLLHKDKAYQVTCRLGQTTTTYDAEGEVILERPVHAIDPDHLRELLAGFTGRIRQTAPIYSAIKQGGQPLYKKARRGEAVEAPTRDVDIHSIVVDHLDVTSIGLTVHCGTGTYIRSLAHDLGERLGCGAHVTALRRLWVSPFADSPMHALDAVQSGEVTPMPTLDALSDWPRVEFSQDELVAITHGQALDRPGMAPGRRAGIAPDGRLVALLECEPGGRVKPVRLLHPDG